MFKNLFQNSSKNSSKYEFYLYTNIIRDNGQMSVIV